MFSHSNIHKYADFSDGETQSDLSLLDDARSFIGADCDTDNYLVVVERLSVSKRAAQIAKRC